MKRWIYGWKLLHKSLKEGRKEVRKGEIEKDKEGGWRRRKELKKGK